MALRDKYFKLAILNILKEPKETMFEKLEESGNDTQWEKCQKWDRNS